MRFPVIALVCVALASFSARLTSQALPPIATQGLDLLVTGRGDSAVRLWTSAWTGPEDIGKRQDVIDGFRQLSKMLGRVHGYDLIRVVDITPHLRRAYFLLRYEKQPVYLLLVLYEAKEAWMVATFNFNTDGDKVLPPTLFGDEHPGRR